MEVKFSKDNFITTNRTTVKDSYEAVKQLGKGGYGKVYQVRHKLTGQFYACKKLSKSNIKNLEKFKREITILTKADHPNIIKLYEIFETTNSYYLIMEECHGGELFDRILERIQNNQMYSEKEAAEIIKQVVSAIEYCHKNGVAHRDIKPENLLYLKAGEEYNNPIKIIDFGLSQTLNTQKKLNSKVGTAYYVAPEILAGTYTEKCDIWSIGVILYILLSGDPPFNGSSDAIIYSKIKKLDFCYPANKWNNISREAKDLLRHMICLEGERYSASEVISHPWFQIVNDVSLEKLNFSPKFFKDYTKVNQLKKIILLLIATRLQEGDINELKEIFKAFDTDNDGQIQYNEFQAGLKKLNSKEMKPDEVQSLFNSIDVDKNGKIDYTEFIAATLQKKLILKQEKLYDAFEMLDKNRDGKISKEELISILKLQPNQTNCELANDLIKYADKNGDGVIDKTEFLEFMQSEC
jgi:calcium-dependent protein kinase